MIFLLTELDYYVIQQQKTNETNNFLNQVLSKLTLFFLFISSANTDDLCVGRTRQQQQGSSLRTTVSDTVARQHVSTNREEPGFNYDIGLWRYHSEQNIHIIYIYVDFMSLRKKTLSNSKSPFFVGATHVQLLFHV